MTAEHRELAAGRWFEMSLAQQLGNIGSEFGRAVRWSASRPDLAERAFHRALELFDLTLDDPRHREAPPTLREIARAREVTADFLGGSNHYRSTAESLQRYFDAFAVSARRR